MKRKLLIVTMPFIARGSGGGVTDVGDVIIPYPNSGGLRARFFWKGRVHHTYTAFLETRVKSI